MKLPALDPSILRALAAVYYAGTDLCLAHDTLAVIRVLRPQRPDVPQAAVAEAMQLAQIGDRPGARLVLEEADARNPRNALIKATLALVLYWQRDSLWQAYADEVAALPPDDKALAVLASIQKMIDNTADDPAAAAPEPASRTSSEFLHYAALGVVC